MKPSDQSRYWCAYYDEMPGIAALLARSNFDIWPWWCVAKWVRSQKNAGNLQATMAMDRGQACRLIDESEVLRIEASGLQIVAVAFSKRIEPHAPKPGQKVPRLKWCGDEAEE